MYAQVVLVSLYALDCLYQIYIVYRIKGDQLCARERLLYNYVLFFQTMLRGVLFGVTILLDLLDVASTPVKDLLDDLPGLLFISSITLLLYLWLNLVETVGSPNHKSVHRPFLTTVVLSNIVMYFTYFGLVYWALLYHTKQPQPQPPPPTRSGTTNFSFAAETAINVFFMTVFIATATAILYILQRVRPTLLPEFRRAMKFMYVSCGAVCFGFACRIGVLIGGIARKTPGSLSILGLDDTHWVLWIIVAYYLGGEIIPGVLLLYTNFVVPSKRELAGESLVRIRNSQEDNSNNERDPLIQKGPVVVGGTTGGKIPGIITSASGSGGYAQAVPLVPPEEIQLGAVIATGTFGVVHLATWRGAQVACKKMSIPYQLTSADLLSEWSNEIALLAGLRHPNIIQMLAATPPPTMYLITEHLSAGNLRTVIKNPKLRPLFVLRTQQRIARDIAQAMTYLHQSSIVHRDLNPNNVLIGSEADLQPVKICDFGLARFKSMARSMTKGVGTPAYMGPEIFETDGWSFNSDVYSYSIVLWELFTLVEPYDGKSVPQIMFSVARGERMVIPSYVPADVCELIIRCWQQVPEDRPSFEEVIAFWERIARTRTESV